MRCPNCGVELVLRTKDELTEKDKHPSLDRVRVALGPDAKFCEFSQGDGVVTIRPKHYLGKEAFSRISDTLKQFDARYISEGKQSRWEV